MKKYLLFLLILPLLFVMNVNAESKYLYDVLKDEAESGGLAKEYTGGHHDSFTEEPTHKIYHWYAENDDEGYQVLEKNNVIFANHCWKIIRTTDTGGVKLLYYGELNSNNACGEILPSQKVNFNNKSDVSGFGYMNNIGYNVSKKNMGYTKVIMGRHIKNLQVKYGSTYTYKSGKYTINNLIEATYGRAVGEYVNGTYNKIDYVSGCLDKYCYDISLYGGENLESADINMAFSDNIININGKYSLDSNSLTYIKKSKWYENYKNLTGKYTCFSNSLTCDNPSYIIETFDTTALYFNVNEKISFSNDFKYDGDKYDINDKKTSKIYDLRVSSYDYKNTHYTCFNESGICEKLYYIFFIGNDYKKINGSDHLSVTPLYYYIELENGEEVEDAIEKMLHAKDVNKNDSYIKIKNDEWFEKNLIDYSDSLEDTIFCNNRKISSLGGWDKNFGEVRNNYNYEITDLYFEKNENKLTCDYITDQFSINNSLAKLKYPIGLISKTEIDLNEIMYKQLKFNFYTMSPAYFHYVSPVFYISSSISTNNIMLAPSISLKKGAVFSSGNGSSDNPYQFDKISLQYKINVEIKNETEDLNVSINDLNQVEYEEEVNFKVTPIKGYKVNNIKIVDADGNEIEYHETDNKNEYTFVMPATDVTIVPSYEKVSSSVNVTDNKNTKEIVIVVNDAKAVVYEDTVKFTVAPEEGYEVDKIIIKDTDDNEVEFKKTGKDNEYEFTMPDTDVVITPYYKKIDKSSNKTVNPLTYSPIIIVILALGIVFFGIRYSKKIKI